MDRVEFQAWLDQFPPETQIEVVDYDPDYGTASVKNFKDDEYWFWEYTDLTHNKFLKDDKNFAPFKFLLLGDAG